jgi:hypothetical protein
MNPPAFTKPSVARCPCSLHGLSLLKLLASHAVFLGEPDVFVPGVGLSAELSFNRSLGVFAGGGHTSHLAPGI